VVNSLCRLLTADRSFALNVQLCVQRNGRLGGKHCCVDPITQLKQPNLLPVIEIVIEAFSRQQPVLHMHTELNRIM